MPLTCFSSATEIARAIRRRRISSVEALKLFLDQYARQHAHINAICTLDAEGALRAAREADAMLARGEVRGPLHGVPVSFKDSHATAGIRTACGFPPMQDHVPAHDGHVVACVRRAGGIVFAKTNVPPLLGAFHTDNPVFGRTSNPWHTGYAPGGSSGGSGAALASGMTPLDYGSDMLGSIRLPAHFCGVAGLKPTQFRISPEGHYPPLPGAFHAGNLLATRGPLARRVEDLLLAMQVISVPDPLDADAIPMPMEAFPRKPFSHYRVAWTDDFGGVPVTDETRAALERTASALEARGCRVDKVSPAGLDFEQVVGAAAEVFSGTIAQGMRDEDRLAWLSEVESTAADGAMEAGRLRGLQLDYASWFRAMAVRLELIVQLRSFFTQWDGWLVPTSSGPAFRHEEVEQPRLIAGRRVPYFAAVATHVAPFNLSGSPAVTIPAALSADGLPIGLQLVGRPWQDMQLLRLAERVQEAIGPLPVAPGVR